MSGSDRSDYILVIDDDSDIRALVCAVLLEEGYEVREAPGAEQALEIVRDRRPSLVLLDLSLLSRSPAEFVAAYRQLPDGTAPIVVMSGHAQVEEVAATLGADGVLEKPFDISALVDTVTSMLASRCAPGEA